ASGCAAYMAQDPSVGVTRFPLRAGGTCAQARIMTGWDAQGGLLLAYRPVASFDQNGDMVVDDADMALIAAKVGTADPTADFNCHGQVTQADVEIARAHLGHAAATPTAVHSPSWGTIKTIYR